MSEASKVMNFVPAHGVGMKYGRKRVALAAADLSRRMGELYRELYDMRTMVGLDAELCKEVGEALWHLGKARNKMYHLKLNK